MKYLIFCMREVSPRRKILASLLGIPIGLMAVFVLNNTSAALVTVSDRHAPISTPVVNEIKKTLRTTEVKHGPINKEVSGDHYAPETFRRYDNNALCFRYALVCGFYGINRLGSHQRMQPGAILPRSHSTETGITNT